MSSCQLHVLRPQLGALAAIRKSWDISPLEEGVTDPEMSQETCFLLGFLGESCRAS
jgi:hypothetical protein